MKKKWKKALIILGLVLGILLCMCQGYYLLQRYWAHRNDVFKPTYEKLTLTTEMDEETIFRQTGLGPSAAKKVLDRYGIEGLQEMQTAFFEPPNVTCQPLLWWITRMEQYDEPDSAGVRRELVDLMPGDILVSLSTHTIGWNHGHAALVVNNYQTIESMVLGSDSCYSNTMKWTEYADYAVLRVKGATAEERQAVASYASEHLVGVPYDLFSGVFGEKAPDPDSEGFGLQCASLVWYAWNQFGYDLDADGGRIVTPEDLLRSDLLEVVQIYGRDPEEFLK